MAMVTFQCPNLFPNCLLTLGIGTKVFISPYVLAGFQKLGSLELRLTGKVCLVFIMALAPFQQLPAAHLLPTHSIISASSLMKIAQLGPCKLIQKLKG